MSAFHWILRVSFLAVLVVGVLFVHTAGAEAQAGDERARLPSIDAAVLEQTTLPPPTPASADVRPVTSDARYVPVRR